jgi:hypothetical protein
MADDRITYFLDERAPRIIRRLTSKAGDFDVDTQDFRLRVRPMWSDQLTLDAAMTPDATADTVSYDPADGDFSTEGIYKAWVVVISGDVEQSTDEFEIQVLAHAPGAGVRTGAVWRAARAMTPVAWDSVRGYPDYGDVELQRQVDLAKLRVLRVPLSADAEQALDPRVVDYIAKKVLVDSVLEAAISYWTNQVISRTAYGNSTEVSTYPDRIATTERQLARFKLDLEANAVEVEDIIGSFGPAQLGPVLFDGGRPITPGLDEMPRTMRPARYRHVYEHEWAFPWR